MSEQLTSNTEDQSAGVSLFVACECGWEGSIRDCPKHEFTERLTRAFCPKCGECVAEMEKP